MSNRKDIIEIILLGGILVVLVGILALTGVKTKLENDNKNNGNNNSYEEIFNNNGNNKDEVSDSNKDSGANENNSSSNDNLNNNKDNVSSDNDVSDNNKEESNNNNDNNDNNDNTVEQIPESDKNESSNVIDKPNVNEQEDNKNNKDETVNITEGENAVVSYLTNLNSKLDTYNNENDKNLREKAKDIFVTTVDFLFYDGVIKGYTFDELSLSARLKVLKIVASIDNKIDSYFPNYKDIIKEKCSNLKGKIAVLYLETTNKFCEKVGEDTCNVAREDFNNMKNSFGYTWGILKEALTTSKDKLSLVLSEWYKSIK